MLKGALRELETERLRLRPFVVSDAEAVFEYASDADATEHMAWDTHRELADAEQWIDSVLEGTPGFTYAITRSDRSRAIGGVSVAWDSKKHRVMELGYILHRPHWGNGYIVEAARCLMGYAFEQLEVDRIFAPIYAENLKSRRAAEKMGMQFEGIQRSAKLIRGRRRDECIYSMLRGEL